MRLSLPFRSRSARPWHRQSCPWRRGIGCSWSTSDRDDFNRDGVRYIAGHFVRDTASTWSPHYFALFALLILGLGTSSRDGVTHHHRRVDRLGHLRLRTAETQAGHPARCWQSTCSVALFLLSAVTSFVSTQGLAFVSLRFPAGRSREQPDRNRLPDDAVAVVAIMAPLGRLADRYPAGIPARSALHVVHRHGVLATLPPSPSSIDIGWRMVLWRRVRLSRRIRR